ncbi:unnamed protein product [Rotaria sordida]|uniref:LITAF domain-containing protein n=1 Tax=Rotaria sordida TaxID=392033 RepID=A0A814QCU6_9BILA|nr:unnamed protein product [Rotaria sordida]CAF1334515.1 unnamed protein product [Rotaria sordida]
MSVAPLPPYNAQGYNNYQIAPPGLIIPQPVFIGTPAFIPSEYPVQCVCSRCQQPITTRIEKQNGLLTWLLVGGFLLFGCWFGCCLIPFCVDAGKDTAHYCPSCSQLLGVKKQI